jgi:hypothetical protein
VTMQSEAIPTRMQEAIAGSSTQTRTRSVAAGSRQIRLSARTATLLAAPVTVLATMLVGSVVLTVMGLPLFAGEMISGAMVNLVGGMLAAGAIIALMGKGTLGVAQAGIIGIALRCGTVLMGILMAQLLPLGMHPTILVYWAVGFYFPMLIVESALIAWLSNHLPA